MMRITEHRSWSPVAGCDIVRVSAFDGAGQEYYVIVEERSGAAWRTARQDAVEMIYAAMTQGCDPGRVLRSLHQVTR